MSCELFRTGSVISLSIGGRDGTTYGRSRTSVRSFYKHHTQQLAAAAQVGDAKAIRLKITHEKMCLMKALKAGGRA